MIYKFIFPFCHYKRRDGRKCLTYNKISSSQTNSFAISHRMPLSRLVYGCASFVGSRGVGSHAFDPCRGVQIGGCWVWNGTRHKKAKPWMKWMDGELFLTTSHYFRIYKQDGKKHGNVSSFDPFRVYAERDPIHSAFRVALRWVEVMCCYFIVSKLNYHVIIIRTRSCLHSASNL